MAQAEYTWVPGSAPRWFTRPKTVTHPGTNRAWRRVTMWIETNALPLSQTGNPRSADDLQTTVWSITRSSAIAERPRDASCLPVVSFNSTIHRVQSSIISYFGFILTAYLQLNCALISAGLARKYQSLIYIMIVS